MTSASSSLGSVHEPDRGQPRWRAACALRRASRVREAIGGNRLGGAMPDATQSGPHHEPVMLEEVIRLLTPGAERPRVRAVDLTVGLGGHAAELLAALPADAELLGIDRDPAALARASRRLAAFTGRVHLVHGRFSELPALLDARGWRRVDLVLADLGLSSMQLDDPARGFSFQRHAPLDMRMDQTGGETAAGLLREVGEKELADLLHELGEEPEARRIARAVCRARPGARPATTDELRAVVLAAVRRRARHHDPATLTFQALRIAVNREIEELDAVLEALPEHLADGARVVVLAYHSLEDRRVKEAFRGWTARCVCPPEVPVCRCLGRARATAATRGALRPSQAEVARNPRARSARLRAVEWVDGR